MQIGMRGRSSVYLFAAAALLVFGEEIAPSSGTCASETCATAAAPSRQAQNLIQHRSALSNVEGQNASPSVCLCDPLSRELRRSNISLLLLGARVSSVTPMCPADPEPLQVIQSEDNNDVDVKKLDIPTGIYETLFTIPKTATTPSFGFFNAVAISPVDGIAYASVKWKPKHGSHNAYLVRFNDGELKFLGKLPQASDGQTGFNAAAFSQDGVYYFKGGGKGGAINFIDAVHDLKEFATPGESEVQNVPYSSWVPPSFLSAAQDLVVVDRDLGHGVTRNILWVSGGKVHLSSGEGNGMQFTPSVRIDGGAMGSSWSYGGHIYFTSNPGHGVFRVDIDSIDVSAGTISVLNVGKSQETHKNDGMNCMDAPDPFDPPPTQTPDQVTSGTCERFCHSNGCSCQMSEAKRCKIKSCSGCSYCAYPIPGPV